MKHESSPPTKIYRPSRTAKSYHLSRGEDSSPLSGNRRLGPRIAVIGGGTGLSTMLKGLKEYTDHITAIVTMADDGGGSGVLRSDLGMLPPGDIRNCISALANTEPTLRRLLDYRFTEGRNKGQSFGNLFLAALNGIYGSFEEAVIRMGEVLAITGRVMPVTTTNINLRAELVDGSTVLGESKICAHKQAHNCRIHRISLVPAHPPALPRALEAIAQADIIVLGPGSLYTSIIPNLLVDGISQAIADSGAFKIYILNIMTQIGETEGYTAFDHVQALMDHSHASILNLCLYNTAPIKGKFLAQYAREGSEPVQIDPEPFRRHRIKLAGYPLVSHGTEYARHDPMQLSRALLLEFLAHRKRTGLSGAYDALLHKELSGESR